LYKPLSDGGQFSQIIFSTAKYPNDNPDNGWREGQYIVDDEIVFNFRNVSSESKSFCLHKCLHTYIHF
jgi:hypothetical protein